MSQGLAVVGGNQGRQRGIPCTKSGNPYWRRGKRYPRITSSKAANEALSKSEVVYTVKKQTNPITQFFLLFCTQVFMGWDLLSPWLLNNLYIKNNINNISSIFIYKIEDFLYGNATVP